MSQDWADEKAQQICWIHSTEIKSGSADHIKETIAKVLRESVSAQVSELEARLAEAQHKASLFEQMRDSRNGQLKRAVIAEKERDDAIMARDEARLEAMQRLFTVFSDF